MDDRALLNQYLADRDERAFAELVRRHVDMVYSAARRQVKDPSAAQDVTQHVFVNLAQKGGTIRDREALAGWLLTATRFAALDWLRSESRRRHHETEAAAMKQELFGDTPDAASEWESIQPVLDEAMSRLRPQDRDALALRYFRNLSLADVARELGITTDAANKRIERATDRLRKLFARRGVTTTGQMLSVSLGAYAVTTAPVELAGQIAQQAVSAGAAAGASLTTTKGAVLLMAATKTQVGIAAGVAALALVVVPIVYMNIPVSSAPAPIPAAASTAVNPNARLDEVYALGPAQHLKRVAPPFILERERALLNLREGTPIPIRRDVSAIFRWSDGAIQLLSAETGRTLGDVIKAVTGVWPQDTDIPRPMLATPAPGDWVVREGSTTDQRMLELRDAVSDILGAGMTLRLESIEREVIVARGAFNAARTRVIRGGRVSHEISLADDIPPKTTTTAPTAGEMLRYLGEMMARPILIEAEISDEREWYDITNYPPFWRHMHSYHQSAGFSQSVEVPPGEAIDPYLARVAEQTGLELKRERRIVPTWRLVPGGL